MVFNVICSPIELDTDGLSGCAGREGLMGEFPWKSDGRRVISVEFKRGVVQQLLKGEKTLVEEVSRMLDIQRSVVRQWKRHFEAGATAAVATNEDVIPVSALREGHQRIREPERLLGKKQMESRQSHWSNQELPYNWSR
jgi:transposase-like protein